MDDTQPEIVVVEYLDFRAYLRDFLARKKAANPGYSLRYLAMRLGCNAGFLNRVIKGERNLSTQHVLRLGEVLKLSKLERRFLELLVEYNQAKTGSEREHWFEQLESFRKGKAKKIANGQYGAYARWYYMVLRELLNVIPCYNSADETCRTLAAYLEPRVGVAEIREALGVLKGAQLVELGAGGRYRLKDPFITTGRDMPPIFVNRILTEFADLGRRAIDSVPKPQRTVSSLTFSVTADGYRRVAEKLDECRREVLAILGTETDASDRVYHLNMQLFPVSKPFKGTAI